MHAFVVTTSSVHFEGYGTNLSGLAAMCLITISSGRASYDKNNKSQCQLITAFSEHPKCSPLRKFVSTAFFAAAFSVVCDMLLIIVELNFTAESG